MSDDSEDQLHVLRDYTFLEREISCWKSIATSIVLGHGKRMLFF